MRLASFMFIFPPFVLPSLNFSNTWLIFQNDWILCFVSSDITSNLQMTVSFRIIGILGQDGFKKKKVYEKRVFVVN